MRFSLALRIHVRHLVVRSAVLRCIEEARELRQCEQVLRLLPECIDILDGDGEALLQFGPVCRTFGEMLQQRVQPDAALLLGGVAGGALAGGEDGWQRTLRSP